MHIDLDDARDLNTATFLHSIPECSLECITTMPMNMLVSGTHDY